MYSISGLLQIIEALVVRVLSGGDGGELVGRERSSEESRPPRSKLTYDRVFFRTQIWRARASSPYDRCLATDLQQYNLLDAVRYVMSEKEREEQRYIFQQGPISRSEERI